MKGFQAAAWHCRVNAGAVQTLCVQGGGRDLCTVPAVLLLHCLCARSPKSPFLCVLQHTHRSLVSLQMPSNNGDTLFFFKKYML